MSPPGRTTSFANNRRRTPGPGRAPVPVYRQSPRLDLAARLRASQRTLRSRVDRREALVDVMRAASASLDPEKVAELIVERAGTWVPAPTWAVVAAEPTGQL